MLIAYKTHLTKSDSCFDTIKAIVISDTLSSFIMVELRQYKNDSIWSKDKLALNLPRFLTRVYGQWKRASISKLISLWTWWCRSYFVFALVGRRKIRLLYSVFQKDWYGQICPFLQYRGRIEVKNQWRKTSLSFWLTLPILGRH